MTGMSREREGALLCAVALVTVPATTTPSPDHEVGQAGETPGLTAGPRGVMEWSDVTVGVGTTVVGHRYQPCGIEVLAVIKPVRGESERDTTAQLRYTL